MITILYNCPSSPIKPKTKTFQSRDDLDQWLAKFYMDYGCQWLVYIAEPKLNLFEQFKD